LSYKLTFFTAGPRSFDSHEELCAFVQDQFDAFNGWYFSDISGPPYSGAAGQLKKAMLDILALRDVNHSHTKWQTALNALNTSVWDPVNEGTYDFVKKRLEMHGAEVGRRLWLELKRCDDKIEKAKIIATLTAAGIGVEGALVNEELQLATKKIDTNLENNSEKIKSLLKKTEEEFSSKILEHQNAMARLRDQFVEFSSFSEPKIYWEQKETTHKQKAEDRIKILEKLLWIFGSIFGVFVLAIICVFIVIIYNNISIPVQMYFSIAGVVFFITSGAVWAIRINVRLYLSDVHLASDAKERVVMAQTYLALHFGEQLRDDDRKIILAALFRHTTDGVVRDDAIPQMPLKDLMGANS